MTYDNLPREVLEEKRRMVIRLREALNLTWKEIARLCGVMLSIRTVGLYLQRWGLRPQRPMKRAIEQDAAALQRWQQEVYPQIAERAKVDPRPRVEPG